MTHAHYKHQAPEGVVVCEGAEVHVLEAGHPRVPVLAPRHLALVQALGVVTCGYQILDIVDIVDIVSRIFPELSMSQSRETCPVSGE